MTNLALGCRSKSVATLCENLHEILCEVTASEIKTQDGMGKSIALKDGDGGRQTTTGFNENAIVRP